MATVLELDHVFAMVRDPVDAARRLEGDGWVLDAGQAHGGQGTRNRRLWWGEHYFELLWVSDAAEARANPVRLDCRANWAGTGASPFGLGFRGRLELAQRDEFWPYDALGPRIWVHCDNERVPERPLVFVLEAISEQIEQRRPWISMSETLGHRHPGELREVRLRGPSAPALPCFAGPSIVYSQGAHQLELVVGDEGIARPVSDGVVIRR